MRISFEGVIVKEEGDCVDGGNKGWYPVEFRLRAQPSPKVRAHTGGVLGSGQLYY